MASPFTPFKNADIPLLGQPYELLAWAPTAVLRCKCQPGKEQPVIQVVGFAPALCGACGKVYRFVKVDWDLRKSPNVSMSFQIQQMNAAAPQPMPEPVGEPS